REPWNGLPKRTRSRDVVLFRITPNHAFEDAIAPRLNGHVHVLRQNRNRSMGLDQRGREMTGMRARVAKPHEVRHFPRDRTKEIPEIARVLFERANGGGRVAIAVHRLAEQSDLARAAEDQGFDFGHDFRAGSIPFGSARSRYDAERAALVAALHDRDEGRRSA